MHVILTIKVKMPSSESCNLKPKYKTEDKATATEALYNYIRSIYFITDKEVNV